MSLLTDGNLLPFRQYAEAEVINWYALQDTGLNGQLVALVQTLQDPATSAGGYVAGTSVASAYTNVTAPRYNVTRRVRATTTSDTRFNTLGVTLHTTALTDENGIPLATLPFEKTIERGLVQSGFAVPVLARGVITLKQSQVIGAIPLPGYAGVIATGGGGKIQAINPATYNLSDAGAGVNNVYTGNYHYVGKFLSSSGSAFGGYFQFKLEL